jgi:hypothetical protein
MWQGGQLQPLGVMPVEVQHSLLLDDILFVMMV